MIRYLLGSSALWRILRDAGLRASWAEVISLVVLHDDRDFATAARYLPDLQERAIHNTPQAG